MIGLNAILLIIYYHRFYLVISVICHLCNVQQTSSQAVVPKWPCVSSVSVQDLYHCRAKIFWIFTYSCPKKGVTTGGSFSLGLKADEGFMQIWGGSGGRSFLGFPVRGVLLYQSLKMMKTRTPHGKFSIYPAHPF